MLAFMPKDKPKVVDLVAACGHSNNRRSTVEPKTHAVDVGCRKFLDHDKANAAVHKELGDSPNLVGCIQQRVKFGNGGTQSLRRVTWRSNRLCNLANPEKPRQLRWR